MNLEEIFNSYYDKIYSFTLLRVGSVHDAEDITSNVFVKVAEKLNTYDPDKAAFSTWIFTIALNDIRKHFRDNKSACCMDDIAEIAGSFDIEENLLRHDEYIRLYTAINGLDDREKNILTLRYFGGLSITQVAELLSLSEGNVKVILQRTKEKLKLALVNCYLFDSGGYKGIEEQKNTETCQV